MNEIKTPRFKSLLSKEEITNFKKNVKILKIREIKRITENKY